MPISQSDFAKACKSYLIDWPGAGNDGKSLAQRLDERPTPITEARVKELIAEAIQAQHPAAIEPPVEPPPPPVEALMLREFGQPFRLQETSEDPMLLTEADKSWQ